MSRAGILYFLHDFPRLSQSFVLNELFELHQMGHQVAVFALNNPKDRILHREYRDMHVPVTYAIPRSVHNIRQILSSDLINRRVLRRCLYSSRIKAHLGRLHIAKQCIEFIRSLEMNIDHIHSHFATEDKIAASYAAAHYDVGHTVTAHAYEIFASPHEQLLRTVFDQTNRLIVPSEYSRSYLHEHFDQQPPIDVVPATTRISKFDPSPGDEPTRLLTIARLVEKKGIIYAIKAVAELQRTYPDIEYHIIGSGEREPELRARAAELGVTDAVEFLGRVSDERLTRELDQAAVFVLPCVIAADGDRDSSPVALKEAMAMETPCVSTTLAGIPEIIEEGVNGLLVQPRDHESLAQAIKKLLADLELRVKYGTQGRKTVESKFSMETTTEKLLQSFDVASASY